MSIYIYHYLLSLEELSLITPVFTLHPIKEEPNKAWQNLETCLIFPARDNK
jgi:hypothetical protein